MRQEFTIPGRLASYNDYVDAAHTYWKRTNLKTEQEGIVKAAAQGLKPMRAPVEIQITYYEAKWGRKRMRDLDNVTGGGNKFILDALVSMGILPDDNTETIPRLHSHGYKANSEPRIVVEIEEI